uniref:Putative secreted protein n=1 Tax=Ixodes ricinus TaxID=34613 RepID=A0A6B0TYI4_IXORI
MFSCMTGMRFLLVLHEIFGECCRREVQSYHEQAVVDRGGTQFTNFVRRATEIDGYSRRTHVDGHLDNKDTTFSYVPLCDL